MCPLLEYVGSKKEPTSETVGNGLCAVPGDVAIITRAVEWYCASRGGY